MRHADPSWDIVHVCRGWSRGGVVRATEMHAFAAGKGINVARGLADLGHDAISVGLLGGSFAVHFRHLPRSVWVDIQGATRSNLSLMDLETGEEVHSVSPGPVVQADEWQRFQQAFSQHLPRTKYVVLGGSLPPGIETTAYKTLVQAASERNVLCVVDTSGAALRSAIEARPWAIKPNRVELAELVGRPLEDLAGVVTAAREMIERGIERVAVSLGPDGAMIVTAKESVVALAPAVPVVNSVGCGDAFVAGWLHGVLAGFSITDQLRSAVAAGSANVTMHDPGSIPPLFHQLFDQITPRSLQ